jgi:hypothetical protein
MSSSKVKIMGADTVIALNKKAVLKRYNRTLSSKFIGRLDDDGVNIVVTQLLHGDGDYVRTLTMFKLADRDEPVEAWFDISLDGFNRLAEVERQPDGTYDVKAAT